MKLRFGAAVVALLLAATGLFAHHGNAIYDSGKTVTLKGVVTNWLWANPHCLLDFDVKDESGKVVHWTGELSNPLDIMSAGYSKKMLKPGDEVEVSMTPAKNGEPMGRISRVVFNGKTYGGGQGPAGGRGGGGGGDKGGDQKQ